MAKFKYIYLNKMPDTHIFISCIFRLKQFAAYPVRSFHKLHTVICNSKGEILKYPLPRSDFNYIFMLYQEHNSIGQKYYQNIRYKNFNWEHHMHRHPELLRIIEGTLVVEVDGRVEYAGSGEYALILSNQIHAFRSLTDTLVDVCVFSEDWASAFFKEIQNKKIRQSVFKCRPNVSSFINSELFLCDDKRPDFFMLKSMLYAVLNEYLTQIQFAETSQTDEKVIEQLLLYVRENFTNNISLVNIASELGYDKHYLSRQFHKNVSMHFSRFVNLYRVDYATELLKTTDLSITEIAYKSGFQSIRSFNRAYLEITSCSPQQIRKGSFEG